MTTKLAQVSGLAGIAFFVLFGAWAFLAPRSFFEVVAPWEPYNEHFLRDAGAFSVGIGVGLIATIKAPALGALSAAAAGALLHALSHIVDYGEGGRASDPYTLGALALLLTAGAVWEWRRVT